ncbi:MAG: hypothetical protein WC381_07485 [Kiritimatiellia bacterium]
MNRSRDETPRERRVARRGQVARSAMKKRLYIRTSIFVLLALVTLVFAYKAITAPPDHGYGRLPMFMIYGLFTFVMWIPYNIACMFLDGNKWMGIMAISIVGLTLANLKWASFEQEFAHQTIALLLCSVSLIALWIMSIINLVSRRRKAEPADPDYRATRSV